MSDSATIGPTGPGFIGAYIDARQNLVIIRSDNTTFVAGRVGGTLAERKPRAIEAVQVDPATRAVMVSYDTGDCEHIGSLVERVGPTGATGPTGLGIVHAYVDTCGYLSVMYSDSRVVVAGYVMGPTGPTGPAGQPSEATRAMQLNVLES